MSNDPMDKNQPAPEEISEKPEEKPRDTRLGYSLYHSHTGELLSDGGSGPEVEANQAEFKRLWKELGLPGSPEPVGPRPPRD